MAKSVKRSMALKGNTNAKGGRGGARTGAVTGLFGPVGAFGGGAVMGGRANLQKDKAAGNRQVTRAAKSSATVGALHVGALLGAHYGFKGAISAGQAAILKGGSSRFMIESAAKKGFAIGGIKGAVAGAAIGGALYYGASALGARSAGYKKVNVLKHARHKN